MENKKLFMPLEHQVHAVHVKRLASYIASCQPSVLAGVRISSRVINPEDPGNISPDYWHEVWRDVRRSNQRRGISDSTEQRIHLLVLSSRLALNSLRDVGLQDCLTVPNRMRGIEPEIWQYLSDYYDYTQAPTEAA